VLRAHVTMTSVETGGRSRDAGPGFRPQLHIGQTLYSGKRIYWDCVWSLDSALSAGESALVAIRLTSLPEAILQPDEHLEFYDGETLIATGRVVDVAD
jgi:hypothetical protein